MNDGFNEMICEKCKNPFFASANERLCESCAEQMFDKVKEYIEENPNNSIKQIIADTGVEGKYIKKWIRERRLLLDTPEAKRELERFSNFQQEAEKLIKEEKEKQQEQKEKKNDGGYYTR